MKNKKSVKGITLIALVVTIVVLLILAGVSIAMLAGEAGIIRQAQNAKDKTEKAEIKEKVELAIISSTASGRGNIDTTELQKELEELGWNGNVTSGLPATGTINGMKVTISAEGDVTVTEGSLADDDTSGGNDLSIEELEKELIQKLSQQEGDSAIDQDGNIVDLSLWRITYATDTCSIEGYKEEIDCTIDYYRGYTGRIVDGKIEGNIPTFVKKGDIIYKMTEIGEYTFYSLSGIVGIEIPYTVTRIGDVAFQYCSNLTNITIPDSVTSIGASAFNECSGLTSIEIPDSVTSIGDNAFYDCSSLTSIKVDENNTVFDSRDNCNALIKTSTNELILGCKNTTIPDSVTSIGRYAFYKCRSLTSITIPDSVTSIGEGAFYKCRSLTSIIIPDSVTSIGDDAFYDCSLTSITIPDSVTSIGRYAFDNCTSLTSIIIPDSVTSIGRYAFIRCSSLTAINIKKEQDSISGSPWGASADIVHWNYTGE